MNRKFVNLRNLTIITLLFITITGLFFANYFYAKNYPGGKNFQTQWVATRAALFGNENPYSESVLYKIQSTVYGRPAMAGEFEFRFTYPFFALAIFTPFGIIKSIVVARAAWMLVLELMVVLIYLLSINLGNWKPGLRTNILLLSFFVTFYHSLRAVIDGNLLVLVSLLLIGSLICIRDRHDEAAGILLLGLVLEIQFTIVILIIILWYTINNKRIKIITYFFGSLTIILGFSFLVRPDWISGYFNQLFKSVFDFPYSSFGGVLTSAWGSIGQRLAVTIGVLMAVLLIIEWFLAQRKSFRHFIWFIFLSLIIIQWIGLPSEPGNFFLLMPGLIFVMQVINERWKLKGEMIIFIISLVLYISIWVLFFLLRKSDPVYVEPPLFYIIFPIVELLLLYWSKWWINKLPVI